MIIIIILAFATTRKKTFDTKYVEFKSTGF